MHRLHGAERDVQGRSQQCQATWGRTALRRVRAGYALTYSPVMAIPTVPSLALRFRHSALSPPRLTPSYTYFPSYLLSAPDHDRCARRHIQLLMRHLEGSVAAVITFK